MMVMKRWLSGLLAALLLVTLAGCGGIADLTEAPPDAASSQQEVVDLPVQDPEEAPETDAASPGGEAEIDSPDAVGAPADADLEECWVFEDGTYTSKEDVACYIHFYGRLPDNFITKKEAQALGWPGGSLEPYAPGMCIGGSRFGNYEGLLPEAEGREYTECDIDTLGAKSRGAKRIVFSNDGLIYYTEDHYESFELLYGDEGDG